MDFKDSVTINSKTYYFDPTKFNVATQKTKMIAWIEGTRNFNISCATDKKLAYNYAILDKVCRKVKGDAVNEFMDKIKGELYIREYKKEFNI